MMAGLTARRYCSRWRVPLSSLAIALRSDSNASRSLILWRRATSSSTSCFLVFLSSSLEAAAAGAAPGAGASCSGLPLRLSASYMVNASSEEDYQPPNTPLLKRSARAVRRGVYSAQINTNTRSSDKLFTAIVYLQLRQLSLSLL